MKNGLSIKRGVTSGAVYIRIEIDHTVCKLARNGCRCTAVARLSSSEWEDLVKSLVRKTAKKGK